MKILITTQYFYPENFKIKSYQEDGISWLMENNGRLLADDMGLGKTAQSLVAATNLIRSTEIKRVLIVCPRSLMQNWADEIQIWAQSFKCYVVSSEANSPFDISVSISKPRSVCDLTSSLNRFPVDN